ncbi:MAG: sigma-70 family RNA polymerase sigma factor [Planctomycetota bacterium]
MTAKLACLKSHDPESIQWFVKRFMPSIVHRARFLIEDNRSRGEDADDVAQDVLVQFLSQIDRYEKLENRGHLFQILAMLTKRRAIDAYRRACKRDSREQLNPLISQWEQCDSISKLDPSHVSIEILDALREVIKAIHSPDLDTETILEMRLNGHTVREIATRIGRGERAVYRLLERIRKRLEEFGFDFSA